MSEENPIIATNRDGEQVAQSLNNIFQTGELARRLSGLFFSGVYLFVVLIVG